MSAIQNRLEKMETFFDQKEVVVIDNGTGFIKAGFAGEDMPRVRDANFEMCNVGNNTNNYGAKNYSYRTKFYHLIDH